MNTENNKSVLAVMAMLLLTVPISAWSVDLPVTYEVDAKVLKKQAPAGTMLTFDLHADPTCSSLAFTDTIDIADASVLVEQLKALKVKNGPKLPKIARINATLTGIAPIQGLWLEVTGSGVTPVGGGCQAQASGVEGPQGSQGDQGLQGNPAEAGPARAAQDASCAPTSTTFIDCVPESLTLSRTRRGR